MKNITVGYFDLANKKLLSGIVINENFLDLLSHYMNTKVIPVARRKDLKSCFEEIEKYGLDYLYIDSYEILVESFLLRERLRLTTPFIVMIHTVLPWALNYARVIPLIRKDDVVLAPSKYAKNSFCRISNKFDVHIIPYSLDMRRIRDMADHRRARSGKTIVFMGRLTEKKGVGALIRCMPELIDKAGDVRLNIIGPLSGSKPTDSPKNEYVKRLETEIKKLGLTNRVNLTGLRFGAEKYRLLSRSGVFINPTVAGEETFSIVNIEALACGLPVIATDWAANKELITDGEDGYLVAVDSDAKAGPRVNSEELVSAIVKVLTNPSLNSKLRDGASKSALKYDYRHVLPRSVALLKRRGSREQTSIWGAIKSKSIVGFSRLFNRDFLFFLCGINGVAVKETYGDLYDRMFGPRSIKIKKVSLIKKIPSKKISAAKKVIDAISQDYENFLCLKRNRSRY